MTESIPLSLDRRAFLQVAGVGAATLALAACTTGGASSGGEVSYWVQPNATEKDMKAFFDRLKAQVAKTNPDVTVKPLLVPWEDSLTKLTAAYSTNSPPDVTYQIVPWMNKWRETGVLADFHAIAPTDDVLAFLENVSENLLGPALGPNGELYGIPYVTGGAHNLCINVNAWEAAGKPELPTTYAEMIPFAKALTVDTNGRYLGESGFDASSVATYGMAWPFIPSVQENYIWHYFWSFGTDYISEDKKDIGFDNDEGRAALENMKEMYDSGAATPAGLFTDDSKYGTLLVSQGAGMQWTGQMTADEATKYPEARLQVLEPPRGPGDEAYIVGACGYISVAAKAKNMEAAYATAKQLLTDPLLTDYTKTILALPIHGAEGDFYTDLPDPRMNDFQNAQAKLTQYTRIPPQLPYQPNEYLIGKINDYVIGNQSLDDMIKDSHTQIQQMAASV